MNRLASVALMLAAAVGIPVGDVLVQINRAAVEDAAGAARLLDSFAGRGPIQLIVERGGNLFSPDIVIK